MRGEGNLECCALHCSKLHDCCWYYYSCSLDSNKETIITCIVLYNFSVTYCMYWIWSLPRLSSAPITWLLGLYLLTSCWHNKNFIRQQLGVMWANNRELNQVGIRWGSAVRKFFEWLGAACTWQTGSLLVNHWIVAAKHNLIEVCFISFTIVHSRQWMHSIHLCSAARTVIGCTKTSTCRSLSVVNVCKSSKV